jgi:hypothetical protein
MTASLRSTGCNRAFPLEVVASRTFGRWRLRYRNCRIHQLSAPRESLTTDGLRCHATRAGLWSAGPFTDPFWQAPLDLQRQPRKAGREATGGKDVVTLRAKRDELDEAVVQTAGVRSG